MIPEGYQFYEMTCHTLECRQNGIKYRGLGPLDTAFQCGTCSQEITDWIVSNDQTTKDGCVANCPNPSLHNSWAECYNSTL